MTEKLTDEQLEAIAKDRACAWPESIDAMAIELLFRRACEAERAEAAESRAAEEDDIYYEDDLYDLDAGAKP